MVVDPTNMPVARIGIVTAAVGMMTSVIAAMGTGNRCLCDRCKGKGFDRFTKERSARKCPRCKGAGSVPVGSTKR